MFAFGEVRVAGLELTEPGTGTAYVLDGGFSFLRKGEVVNIYSHHERRGWITLTGEKVRVVGWIGNPDLDQDINLLEVLARF